ncbi:MAG: ATP-binding protein [Lachnospiraceae bacterium]|nr:ATP-binding protein [Lachnospiraceae bacterium]
MLDALLLGIELVLVYALNKLIPLPFVIAILYLFLAVATLPGLLVYYEIDFSQAIMIVAEGYTLQHIAAQIVLTLREPLRPDGYFKPWNLQEIIVYIVVYGLIYYFIIRSMKTQENLPVKEKYLFVIVMLVVVVGLSELRDYYAAESVMLAIISRVFSIICCLFILLVLTGTLLNASMNEEIETLKLLRKMELQHYQKNKENVDLINVKCHDLKRQISVLEKTGSAITKEELERLKKSVDMYDAFVSTENDVLDTILTEKSLYCKEHHIRMTCVADGEKMSFLSPENICAIFGNAIDNAIEATAKVEDEENRLISLKVFERREMLIIELENTYNGEIEMENGVPKTNKKDQIGFHGYGLKSIQLAVNQYRGEVQIYVKERFRLIIMIPK